jgi:hypothetical protein
MNQENIVSDAAPVDSASKNVSPDENKIGEKISTESVSDTPSNRKEEDTSIVSTT